ncbi:serine/threonine-protein phosphatase 6 regulatory ankyrin repeat subunit A-like [Trichogramma pretiosum]|uniref:serine/threonine-protein phosphatase 6 regulatory ankyrin repeat subunit A-like n=1 Tax=Trichogramma pretiosum TaxID=7493 RepID=UPI000C71C280|nr:serine/threonine-protein phosphatase 6 regulatory ankyrin repeat subunit A-like [Trichogramma pretiosum]
MLALAYNKIEALKALLRRGADPNLADAKGSTLLHDMCKRGDDLDEEDDAEALARRLFEIGAENEALPRVRLDALDGEGSAALHLAVGRRGLVELLLRQGADPNVADAEGFTTLHLICKLDPNFAERFFAICDEVAREVRLDARDKLGRTALHVARGKTLIELLLRRGADPNAADEEGSTPLHILCRDSRDKNFDYAKRLLEVSEEIGRPLLVNARDKNGWTPLHLALDGSRKNLVDWLLRRAGAYPCHLDSEGRTPLHVICDRTRFWGNDDNDDDLVDVFCETVGEIAGEVGPTFPDVDAQDERGNTPLHLALGRDRTKLVESLLRRGADPNLANAEGSTPLHVICRENSNPPSGVKIVDIARRFFDVSDDVGRPVDVDARDDKGNTPLHLVLQSPGGIEPMTKLLLSRGADVNLANEAGSTPLHVVSKRHYGVELAAIMFEASDERQRTVRIDARDNEGNTPLCLALLRDDYFVRMTPLLLRRGANPNLANAEGLAPLHIICRKQYDRDNVAKVFFEINDERRQTVDVDARDSSGRTPLQLAVRNLLPNAVDQLLDHGADLAGFVFPSEEISDERFSKETNARHWRSDSLGAATNALAVIERLESRGYRLDRSDAMRFMKFFAEHKMFGEETKPWYFNNRFGVTAENITMIPDMSLYDLLTKFRPKEAAKLLTLEDFARLRESQTFQKYLKWHYNPASYTHLSEILLGGFCRRWALDSFWELIHKRLPLECCDMIMDHLMNKDLWNICLAAAGQSS